ncbi:MAG: hypothetical protein PHY92_10300, partial [Alphaproteobacteria bacterium]|nr:hypothetical protein [Alphaproteobacteria bacterium]
LKVHGRITKSMEIEQPMVLLHPGKDMTFVLKMNVSYSAGDIGASEHPMTPTFWLNSHDIAAKHRMQEGIKQGKSYVIAPPYSVTRNNGIYLPIIERPQICGL